jgi:uncharacterized protein (TIGR02996 family)
MSDSSLRKALEEELFANPDDLATHAAYADLLGEMGDPRGEFIQVRIALDDPELSPEQRDELLRRELDLWLSNRERWLGPLAPHLLDQEGVTISFRRGWLDTLELARLSLPLARLLRDAPQARLLRHLVIESADDDSPALPDDDVPEDEYQKGFWPLVGAPCLRNIRVFRVGEDQGDDHECFRNYLNTPAVASLVRSMPDLEELYIFANSYNLTDIFTLPTLKHLRILKAYHRSQVHRLDVLAANPAFRNLTHLLLHPHALAWHDNRTEDQAAGFRREEGYLPLRVVQALLDSPNLPHLRHLQLRLSSMGDDGCKAIVESGILKRLKSLDLRHGRITDAGARLLVASPDIRSLERLDLGYNALSADGAALVAGLGPGCRAEPRHGDEWEDEDEEEQYLHEGDYE